MPHETSIVGLFCPAQAPSYSFLAMFHSRFRNCCHLCEYITSDHPDHYYHFERIQPFLGVDFAKDFYQEPAKCQKKTDFAGILAEEFINGLSAFVFHNNPMNMHFPLFNHLSLTNRTPRPPWR